MQRSFKAARKSIRIGDTRDFRSRLERAVPRIRGLGEAAEPLAEIMSAWVSREIAHSDANQRALARLREIPRWGDAASLQVITKWLLAVGLFSAADMSERVLARSLASRRFPSREELAALALWSDGRSTRPRGLARVDWSRPLGFGALIALAEGQVAAVTMTQEDEDWRRLVGGRRVGVLGPAPMSAEDRAAVLTSDIVVAPLAFDGSGSLLIPEEVDVAYVRPPLSDVPTIEGDGVLVLAGGEADSAGLGDLEYRSAIVPRASGLVGHPTVVPEIIVDLLLGDAREVVVSGVDLYLSGEIPYRSDAVREDDGVTRDQWNSNGSDFFVCSGFATHPPIEQKKLIRRLMATGRLRLSESLLRVVEASHEEDVKLLDSVWGAKRK